MTSCKSSKTHCALPISNTCTCTNKIKQMSSFVKYQYHQTLRNNTNKHFTIQIKYITSGNFIIQI